MKFTIDLYDFKQEVSDRLDAISDGDTWSGDCWLGMEFEAKDKETCVKKLLKELEEVLNKNLIEYDKNS